MTASTSGSILGQAAAAGSSGWLTIVILLFIAGGGYGLSVLLHPYKHCPTCKGSPRSYGAIYTKSFRLCSRCGGSGRVRRFGAGEG
ncbi:hypothetical protein [Pseudonocardia sp.]|uniref:hypothetical protein n=1 Tax=Pseudonocardia sp. TaxID=60912 RepID=UPI003D0E0DDF